MSKICPNCGVNSPDNTKFCIECGYDLEDTSISIAKALDEDLSNLYEDFFRTLAKVYYEYISFNKIKTLDFTILSLIQIYYF